MAMFLVQITLNNTLTYYGALSHYGEDIPLGVRWGHLQGQHPDAGLYLGYLSGLPAHLQLQLRRPAV